MAVKISGTDVITNARNLENVSYANVDTLYGNSINVVNSVTTNIISFNTNSSKDKIRLYDSEIPYALGMANRMTFGPLRDDWAMTFQMNDDIDRGFWWGDVAHTNAQGAMALTTDGNLYVASKIRLGFGETDTADQETWIYNLDVSSNVNSAAFLINGTSVTSISNAFASATIAGANTAVGTGANAYAAAIANTISVLAYNKANTANLLAYYANINAAAAFAYANTLSGSGGGSGQVYTANGNNSPTSPALGDEWLQSNTGTLYTYVNTANGNNWVELSAYSYASPPIENNIDGGTASTNYGGITGIDAGGAS